jgi:predicted ATP-binding protein involved in virulence
MFKFRIQKLSLEGFRGFEKATLDFPKNNILLLIGNNGKGKTTILDSIALLLNDFVKRVRGENPKLYPSIHAADINKIMKKARLQGCFETDNDTFMVTLAETATSNKKIQDSYYRFLERFQQNMNTHSSIPIVAYYKSVRFFKPTKSFKNLLVEDVVQKTTFPCYDNAFSTHDMTFEDFQTWFRLEEDQENDTVRRLQDFKYTNYKLDIIRNCIDLFFKHLNEENIVFTDLHVKRIGLKSILIIKKEAIEFELDQLSDGERMLLLCVCDIARRLALAQNEPTSDALSGTGIVLIDEIEMHLHPQWQRTILPALNQTFPNIQFIVASHSTPILSQVKRESIRILDNGHILMPSSNPIGRDANSIMEEIQQVSKRPKAIEALIEVYLTAIHRNDAAKTIALKNNLLNYLDSEDPIFAKAEAMITRKKLLMP